MPPYVVFVRCRQTNWDPQSRPETDRCSEAVYSQSRRKYKNMRQKELYSKKMQTHLGKISIYTHEGRS